MSGLKFSTTILVRAGSLNEAQSKFKSAHRFENIGHGASPPRTPKTSFTPPPSDPNKLTAESSSTKIAMRMQLTQIHQSDQHTPRREKAALQSLLASWT
mmetsp:Transcript_99296/g.155297  ORF Transcript_99296/g.155297 Transcript_99296/m.155297 type:complete len:99 (+) Transcript_99296:2094-2390(+)